MQALPIPRRYHFSRRTRARRIDLLAWFVFGVIALLGAASSSSFAEPVIWEHLKNTSPTYSNSGNGSTLTKTSGLASWNSAGASSQNRIEANGSLSFRFGSTTRKMMVGLSYQDKDLSVHSIDFGFVANCDADLNFAPGICAMRIQDHRGGLDPSSGPFATTDVFTI